MLGLLGLLLVIGLVVLIVFKLGPALPKKDEAPSRAPKDAPQTTDFMPATRFSGSKPGYVFKTGESGLGYYVDNYPYRDDPPESVQVGEHTLDAMFS